jgi:hypothetical protein
MVVFLLQMQIALIGEPIGNPEQSRESVHAEVHLCE